MTNDQNAALVACRSRRSEEQKQPTTTDDHHTLLPPPPPRPALPASFLKPLRSSLIDESDPLPRRKGQLSSSSSSQVYLLRASSSTGDLEDVELLQQASAVGANSSNPSQQQQRDARSISPTPTSTSPSYGGQYRYTTTSSKAFAGAAAVEDSPDSSKKKTIKFSPLSLVMLPITNSLKKQGGGTSSSPTATAASSRSSSSSSSSGGSVGGGGTASSLSVAYGSAPPAGGIAPPPRSESMAYPVSTTSSMLSKFQYLFRKHSSSIMTATAFLIVILFVLEEEIFSTTSTGSATGYLRSSSSSAGSRTFLWGGAVRPGYFVASDAIRGNGNEFLFAAVADLDELSRLDPDNLKKPEFYSWLLPGSIRKLSATGTTATRLYEIELGFADKRKIVTKHNEAGRGAEFSELTLYENRLVTFDDRTGKVFEILNNNDGTDSYVVPRFVFSEGDGDTDKGMKWEWSTVKDGELYMGSMGKEYTLPDGTVKNRNNLWIAVINRLGQIRRVDWSTQYGFVRKALNCDFPGYLIIEACRWSNELKKWVFLPRRISREAYDEVKDEQKGGRELVLVDDAFTTSTVVKLSLDSQDPLKGFSTFAFIPTSGDRHALAIRSVEENCVEFTPACQQRSYFVVIDVTTGEQLSDEVKYPENGKFEGVEFVDLSTKPPKSPTK